MRDILIQDIGREVNQQVLDCTISDSSLCCNRRSNGQISMLEPKEENIHTKAKVNSKYEIGGEIAERAIRGWMRPTIKSTKLTENYSCLNHGCIHKFQAQQIFYRKLI